MLALADSGAAGASYRDAQPWPHVVVDDVVSGDLASTIADEARRIPEPALEHQFSRRQHKLSSSSVVPLGPCTSTLLDALAGPELRAFAASVTRIDGLESDPEFCRAGLFVTPPGGWQRVHEDFRRHPVTGRWNRVIALLYCSEWHPGWGGELELWRSDMRAVGRRIEPLPGRLVIFETTSAHRHGIRTLETIARFADRARQPLLRPDPADRSPQPAVAHLVGAPRGDEARHPADRRRGLAGSAQPGDPQAPRPPRPVAGPPPRRRPWRRVGPREPIPSGGCKTPAMPSRSRLRAVALVTGLTLSAAACSSGGSSGSTAGSSGTVPASSTTARTSGSSTTAATTSNSARWPMYHRTIDRAGAAPGFAIPHHLARAWDTALDGAVYGQPIVVGDAVIAATEGDTVYALDLATGHERWHRNLGTPAARSELPCGNIDPLGITGTPAYDATTGLVYVATETTGAHHDLVALDPATGTVRFTRNLDVTNRDRAAEQERAALAVANGRVYVAFGGLFGDCGNYVGYVVAVPADGTGSLTHYEVPTAREGGIWAASGPAIGADGDVYVAVGNGASTGGTYDGSDSVLRLARDLSARKAYFAPDNWGSENAADADLGSTGPLLLPGHRALIAGKGSNLYLLDTDRLGGIGGQLATVPGCRSFGGMAADGSAAFVPCADGLTRVDVHGNSISKAWQADSSIIGSPVVGGGAVWSLDAGSGVLDALDEATGHVMTTAAVGAVTRFASPVLAANRVIVGTENGVVVISVS